MKAKKIIFLDIAGFVTEKALKALQKKGVEVEVISLETACKSLMTKTNAETGKGTKDENLLPVKEGIDLLSKDSGFKAAVNAISKLNVQTKIMLGAHSLYTDTRFLTRQADAQGSKIIDYQRLALLLAALLHDSETKVEQPHISLIVCYGGRSSMASADPTVAPTNKNFLLDSIAFKLLFLLTDRYECNVLLTARTGSVRFNQETGSAEVETDELLKKRLPAIDQLDIMQRKKIREVGKGLIHVLANKAKRLIEKNNYKKGDLPQLKADLTGHAKKIGEGAKKLKIEGLNLENQDHIEYAKEIRNIINIDNKGIALEAIITDLAFLMLVQKDYSFVKDPVIYTEVTPDLQLLEGIETQIENLSEVKNDRPTAAKYGKLVYTHDKKSDKYKVMDGYSKKIVFEGKLEELADK